MRGLERPHRSPPQQLMKRLPGAGIDARAMPSAIARLRRRRFPAHRDREEADLELAEVGMATATGQCWPAGGVHADAPDRLQAATPAQHVAAAASRTTPTTRRRWKGRKKAEQVYDQRRNVLPMLMSAIRSRRRRDELEGALFQACRRAQALKEDLQCSDDVPPKGIAQQRRRRRRPLEYHGADAPRPSISRADVDGEQDGDRRRPCR